MNKKVLTALAVTAIAGIVFITQSFSLLQNGEPWKESQLMQPASLAKILNDSSAPQPFIISVSPEGMYGLDPGKGIKGSVEFGAAEEKANLEKLKAALSGMDRSADIVLYCGCCPFRNCPNIRPAFRLLTEMKFENHKLLDLSRNIKEDWINKGYPMNR